MAGIRSEIRHIAASLLFFKLDMMFTAAVSPEATGKGRRVKWSWTGCSQEYLPCRSMTTGVHQQQPTEGDAQIVWSSSSCDVRCSICILGVLVTETPLKKASRLLKIQAAHAIIGHTDVNERTKCTEITN